MLQRIVLLCVLILGITAVATRGRDATPAKPAEKGVEGIWQGTLKVGAVSLRLAFHISMKDGKRIGTFDSIDQNAKGLPIDEVKFTDGQLTLEMKKYQIAFTGKMKPDGSAIEGEFAQAGMKFPMTLQRSKKVVELVRPQHPKKPYPYKEEEVTFENKKGGVKLAGALTLPPRGGPFPAVVLITGSGPQDRDETLFGHKPFLVLADHLTRKGIAVLRVDDRGVGGSTGSTSESTTADFTGDVLAAVDFLKGRKEIDAKQIGLMGHSEGGIIAPLAASQSRDVAFIILLAGTGLPGEEILYLQGQAILKASGATEKEREDQRTVQGIFFRALKEEKDNDKAKKLIRERLAEWAAKQPPEAKKDVEKGKAAIEGQMKMAMTPWFRYFVTLDPRPALRKVRVPVLALVGEKDLQVPPKENLKAIAAALKEGGNTDFTTKELPGLNHLFQTCKTGNVSEYGTIEETFAPAALKEISDWIAKRVKASDR